jgi:hypothetical protein
VTLEGWIFMVGLRVFDVGALIVWLVWFFKLRDDDDDGGGDDDLRGGEEPPEPKRRRDHSGDRPPASAPAHRPVHPPTPQRPRTPARH